jgi:lipopolysaccharide/colanic/teichoic acid biosynthesis glycosyltransferase
VVYSKYLKRFFDIFTSFLLLISLSPFLLISCAFIFLSLGRPILFKQTRIGLNSVPFTMLKFRTMLEKCDEYGTLLPTSERLTKVGRVFRRTSLDELPGLINVMRGDMSLVGPRPLLAEYLDRFSNRQSLRHKVRPGVTGLSQVNGRNVLDWCEKLELDVQYVERYNFPLDVMILWRTLRVVISGSGVEINGGSEMPNFRSE